MPSELQRKHNWHKGLDFNQGGGGSSLAVSDAKLLPHRVLVDVGLQASKVIAEGANALLPDVIHVHGGVGRHDGSKLSGLAVLQGELTHEIHIPAVA